MTMAKRRPPMQFWEKVNKQGPVLQGMATPCWEWTGCLTRQGYGSHKENGELNRSHRWGWEKQRGPIPSGLCVLHKCDNRKCVRGSHLFLGTIHENNTDRANKKRGNPNRGAECNLTKLTPQAVRAIRRLYAKGDVTQSKLAKRFNIVQGTVSLIVRGQNWAHLEAA